VDRDRPDYQTLMRAQYVESLGDRYVDYEEYTEEPECSICS